MPIACVLRHRGGDRRQSNQRQSQDDGRDQHHLAVGYPIEKARQHQGRRDRAAAEGSQSERNVALTKPQPLHDDDRVDEYHCTGRRRREGQREQSAKSWSFKIDTDATRGLVVDAAFFPFRRGLGQNRGDDKQGRGDEADCRPGEQPVIAHHRQQRGGECRAGQAFHIVGQSRQRQGPRVIALFREHIGDRRLKGRCERCGSRLQREDQNIDLPDLGHKRQADRHQGPDHVHADQQHPARYAVGEGARDRCDTDIGDHLDRQRGSEHRARVASGNVIGEQPERHGRKTGADQRDDLRKEQVAVGSVG